MIRGAVRKMKGLAKIFTIALACLLCAGIAGCAKHEHTAGTEWKSDATYHWHECVDDGEIMDKAEHIPDGEWHTDGVDRWHECTECGVQIESTKEVSPVITLPEHSASAVYNGEKQGCGLTACDAYTVTYQSAGGGTLNDIPVAAGEYTVTVSLIDKTDTKWSDGTADDKTFTFTINKKNVTAPEADTTTFTYTGSEQTYGIAASDDYTIENNKRTVVGQQTVTVALKDKDNTQWGDETTDDKTFTFTINKKNVTAPVADNTTFYCTGSEQTYNIAASDDYTIQNNKRTDAGEQTVTVVLKDKDNTQWSDETTTDKSFTFTISHNHVWQSGDGKDEKKCACGDVTETLITALTDRQEVLLTASDASISLGNDYNGFTVKSIRSTVNETTYDFGTTLTALTFDNGFKTDTDTTRKHGEQTVAVVVQGSDEQEHTVTVPVLFVTERISNANALQTLLGTNPGSGQTNRSGYYILDADVGYTLGQSFTNLYGTFDGNGKTVTLGNINNGLFSYICNNAVIKDLTVNASYDSGAQYRSVLANTCQNALIENCEVIYSAGSNSAATANNNFLFRTGCTNTTFRNFTISAAGKKIGSVFGTNFGKDSVTFQNCVIIADEIGCMGINDGTQYQLSDVSGIASFIGAGQDISLYGSAAQALDLKGLATGRTVSGITYGSYDLGSDLSSLTLSDDLKNDLEHHGSQVVTVAFTDGYSAKVPVTFVTGEITTAAEFIQKVQISTAEFSSSTVIYGYYILGDDLTFTSNVNGAKPAEGSNVPYVIGFCGTFDGREFTISTSGEAEVYHGGFFGVLGKGAVVKNVNFKVSMHTGGGAYDGTCVIAFFGRGATVEDVKIDFDKTTADTRGGVLVGMRSGEMTYRNVILNASGQTITCVFGVKLNYCNEQGTETSTPIIPTCENVVVNAAAVSCIGSKQGGIVNTGDHIAAPAGYTFNVTPVA